MNIQDLVDELNLYNDDTPVYIEINGVSHTIHGVTDDSQGVYIVVDCELEERELH
jgi:hypothetical protein